MAMNNATILAKVALNATNDYQQNVPFPTQQNIASTVEYLMDPGHVMYRNQFLDILVNKIGYTYVHNKRFTNPLAIFKRSRLNYGNIVEEIAPAWVKAHSFDDEAVTLLKMNRPKIGVVYHSQNRRDMYPISVNDDELRSAFTDDYGLNQLVAAIMQAPYNSDEYDELRIMLNLLALYETSYGFYKVNLANPVTDEESGKAFLTQARAIAGKMTIPNAAYNADLTEYGMPVIPTFVADADELILITTFDVQANLDVNTLASLFNLDKAEIKYRVKLVDEIPISGAVAVLTTTDFFVQHDTNYQTTSFFNPQTLTTNYYLHHWGVYSVSPFVPAVLFTTDTGTTLPVVTETVTGLTLTAASDDVQPGSTVQLTPKIVGTLAASEGEVPETVEVVPDSVTYSLVMMDNSGSALTPNSRTYIDENNVLHIQKSGVPAGSTIEVTAKSTYINPNGATPTGLTASTTITIGDTQKPVS